MSRFCKRPSEQALASAMRENAFVAKGKSDSQLLSEFIDFKRGVASAKGKSFFGDMVDIVKDRTEAMDKIADAWDEVDRVQPRYQGTLLFLIAHEFGHFAMDHHQLGCDISACQSFAARELAADRYAGFLLGALVAPILVTEVDLDEEATPKSKESDASGSASEEIDSFLYQMFSTITGSTVFFEDAYRRAGFDATKASQCDCSYPDVMSRRKVADEAIHTSIVDYGHLYLSDKVAAQKTSPIRVHYNAHRAHISMPDWLRAMY